MEKLVNEDLIKRNIKLNRYKVITNIILIIIFLAIGFYIFHEIEAFKSVAGDVCKLCMQKTGANCIKIASP